MPRRAPPWRGLSSFRLIDAMVERHQCLHQPFKRNVLQLVAPHLGHLGLRHAGDVRSFGLTETALVDQFIELDRQDGLCRQLFRILEPEVGQHVVGALRMVFARHHDLPLAP